MIFIIISSKNRAEHRALFLCLSLLTCANIFATIDLESKLFADYRSESSGDNRAGRVIDLDYGTYKLIRPNQLSSETDGVLNKKEPQRVESVARFFVCVWLFLFWKQPVPFWNELISSISTKLKVAGRIFCPANSCEVS